jgi:uncharacterized protein YycO
MSATLGKVVLFKGGDPISWLVKWQTRSVYSHAALLIPGTRTVIESYPGSGVRIRFLNASDLERVEFYDVKGMDEEQWQSAISFARAQIGAGYDWWSVLRFVSKRPARENGRWFCSELVHKAISEQGIRILERIPSAEISPALLGISPILVPASEIEGNVIG